MQQRGLPFSRIRAPRVSNPRALTAGSHRASFLIAHREPDYPPEAQSQGIQGKVVLDVVVDREGKIQSLQARSGHPLLAEAALRAVREWRYRPSKVNGVPVEVQTDIEFSFRLPDEVISR